MLLTLTDHLRCTARHEDTWLVARADRVEAGRMVEGALGCPICRVERPVRAGIVHWSGMVVPTPPPAGTDPGADAVMRAGALLAFSESQAPFILCGATADVAVGLAPLAEAPLVLLDPPDDRAARFATIIRGAPAMPFAARSVRGIAVDDVWATAERLASGVMVLAPGGRLVAPARAAVPAGVRELARDDAQWVAERAAAIVPLSRRAPAAS